LEKERLEEMSMDPHNKHLTAYTVMHDPILASLVTSAAKRDQWHIFFRTNEPLYSAVMDLALSHQLDDSQAYKLLAIAYAYKDYKSADPSKETL
jgi:hypothetical protein